MAIAPYNTILITQEYGQQMLLLGEWQVNFLITNPHTFIHMTAKVNYIIGFICTMKQCHISVNDIINIHKQGVYAHIIQLILVCKV